MSALSRTSRLAAGIGISLALHVASGLAGYLVGWTSSDEQPASDAVVWLDIETPPPPPRAEMPADEDEKARAASDPDPPAASKPPADQPVATVTETDRPPEPEPTPAPILSDASPDAGPDATLDAGADATLDALADAVFDAYGDAGELVPMASADDGGPADASTSRDGSAQASTVQRSPGADANLLAYLPAGDLVTVMIRFDRLRTSPWPQLTEAILAPMPDYRSLIGTRDLSITQLFDTLVISSSDPRDVMATTLVGHTRMAGRDARTFVDHAESHVVWQTARGGPLGRRQRSRLVYGKDPRVFLMPFPGWLLLCQPRYLGVLVEPAAGDIDLAAAQPADLPAWLAGIRSIEKEAGKDSGPALIVTLSGDLLPDAIDVPYLGTVHGPERASAAFEVARQGFYVRGTLQFASPARAAEFVAQARKAKRDLVTTRFGKILLGRFHVYNALDGLSLETNGARVGFATSLSIADAVAMLEAAAVATRELYGEPGGAAKPGQKPTPAPQPAPAQPAPKQPPPKQPPPKQPPPKQAPAQPSPSP